MRFHRNALAITLSVAVLAGLATFSLRAPPVASYSIERAATYQNEQLLARAWALPVARLYGPQGYLYQPNASFCGPTSIANLLRSEGRPANPDDVLKGSGVVRIAGFLPNGLTLDQEAEILERNAGKKVTVLRDLSLEAFRAEMTKSNDPSRRIVVNFARNPLFGRGHGHFSPILGYLPEEDLVFVGDVNASFRPWLVPTDRLYEAHNTIDNATHAKRGLLEIEAPQPPDKGGETPH
jgi:hypothetical protein